MKGAAKIALAKPQLTHRVTQELLKVKTAKHKTEECRNIVLGQTITAEGGTVIAGARDESGAFVDTAAFLRERGPHPAPASGAGANTTLAVVATDFRLSRLELQAMARQAMNAIVRRIAPANTPFDGDLVFACSSGKDADEITPTQLLRIGLAAEWALAQAIGRAVRPAEAGDPPHRAPD